MKSKIILLVVLLLLDFIVSFAQGGYMKGYVITNTNDTLFGTVKDRDILPYIMFTKIKFKPEDGGKKMVFSATQIKAYKKGDDFFESLSCFLDTDVFVKVIHKGFLSLYKYEFDRMPGSTLLLKKKNDPCVTEVNGIDIRNQLLNYFNDCKPAWERIKERELSGDQLADIVTLYNQNYKGETK